MSVKTELAQVSNFAETFREENIKNVKGLCGLVVKGLYTIVPEEVKSSGFTESKEKVSVANALLNYQVWLNDRIDFTQSGRKDIGDIIGYLKTEEEESRSRLRKTLEQLGSDETNALISTTIKEIELAESHFHLFNREPSFDDTERYRNLVNAISNYALSALILGEDKFADKRVGSEEPKTWDELHQKYSWIMNSEYSNDSQRAVIIMHKLAMAAQIYDDWKGQHIDRQLGIESFATAALREKGGNKKEAEQFLLSVKDAYEREARELGIGLVPQKGFDFMQKVLQDGMAWATKTARFSQVPVIRKNTAKAVNKLGNREMLYAEGKI